MGTCARDIASNIRSHDNDTPILILVIYKLLIKVTFDTQINTTKMKLTCVIFNLKNDDIFTTT